MQTKLVVLLAGFLAASCGPGAGDEDAESEGQDLVEDGEDPAADGADGTEGDPVVPDGADATDPVPDDAAVDDVVVDDVVVDDVVVDDVVVDDVAVDDVAVDDVAVDDVAVDDVPVEPPPNCGDGDVNGDEECDDGNLDNSDECTTFCLNARCGDGFIHSGYEECDDGNTVSGDGCEADCTSSCEHTDTTPPFNDPDCDDGDECTVEEICDPYVHSCTFVNAADGVICNGGGNLCTGVLQCQSGVCTAMSPMDCSDGNQCTSDACDPADGCVNERLPDGTACEDGLFCTTGDHCDYGYCVGSPDLSLCDDSNPCTYDICHEGSGSYTCTYETGSYVEVACGGSVRHMLTHSSSEYSSVTCSGTNYSTPGPDGVWMVQVPFSGTLTVTLGSSSAAGTTVFILTDPCSSSSCLDRGSIGDPASASVSAGIYYVLAETTGIGGRVNFTVSCP